MPQTSSVLITGVGGLLGYHLATYLLGLDLQVIGISRTENPLIVNLKKHTCFQFFVANIENPKELEPPFSGKVDVVYHLASQPSIYIANNNPHIDLMTNVVGTVNILEEIRNRKISRIIYPSTGDVYNNTYLADEKSLTEPVNFYGLSKLTAEKYIQQYSLKFGINYTILRLAILYGPHFRRNAMYDIMSGLIQSKRIRLVTSLNSELDFVFVEDAVQALSLSNTENWDRQIVNISTGEGIKVGRLLDLIANRISVTNPDFEIVEDIASKKVYLNERANLLGWSPNHTLTQGIEKTLAWLLEATHGRL
jgi:UDP-glucose 4-epimerase